MNRDTFINAIYANAPGSPIRELKRYAELPGMISLAGGYPAPELMDVAVLQQIVVDLAPHDFGQTLEYGGTEGSLALRQQLAKLSTERGMQANASDVLTLSGSQQGLDLLARTITVKGDVVLVEAPTYPAALSAFRFAGAAIHQVALDEEGVILQDLEEAMATLRPKLFYTVPTFGNPTGLTLSPARRKAVLELGVRYDCLIVEDDPYSELYFDACPPQAIYAQREKVAGSERIAVYLSSLSKTVAPGLRLGWMLGSPDIRRACVLAKQTDDMHASTLTQALAAIYLSHGLLQRHLPLLRNKYGDRAKALAAALRSAFGSRIEFFEPQGGMFIWAKLGRVDTTKWLQQAIQNSVLFVPGAAFFAQISDPSTFRLSFATQDEPGLAIAADRLATAVRLLEKA
jgi:2-aminoadipate transaminase